MTLFCLLWYIHFCITYTLDFIRYREYDILFFILYDKRTIKFIKFHVFVIQRKWNCRNCWSYKKTKFFIWTSELYLVAGFVILFTKVCCTFTLYSATSCWLSLFSLGYFGWNDSYQWGYYTFSSKNIKLYYKILSYVM